MVIARFVWVWRVALTALSSIGSFTTASRYIAVWITTLFLVLTALAVLPAMLSSASISVLLPLMSFLAIVSLDQMLVIMMGGSDLSMF